MSKSILVINDEELQFLKNVTNQYRQSNLKPEYYSIVEKIRSNELQDTTELLEALEKMENCIVTARGYSSNEREVIFNKLYKALGGKQ
jgi:hypothetical protein